MNLPPTYIRIYHFRGPGGYTIVRCTDDQETLISHPNEPIEIIEHVAEWPDLPIVCRENVAYELQALGFDEDGTRILALS